MLEILAESIGAPLTSNKVLEEYKRLVDYFGSETTTLLKASTSDLEKVAGVPRIVEGIKKVRSGDIVVEPGFDGVYGVVKIWPTVAKSENQIRKPSDNNPKQAEGQVGLF